MRYDQDLYVKKYTFDLTNTFFYIRKTIIIRRRKKERKKLTENTSVAFTISSSIESDGNDDNWLYLEEVGLTLG